MTRTCKVLVVEDNDGIREFLQALFDDEGYEIAVADSGEQMRLALAQHRFDVALIDITLPGVDDGFALAGLARAAGSSVILVTGDTRRFDAVKASGYPYLLKPFRVERLLALVGELLAAPEDWGLAQRRGAK